MAEEAGRLGFPAFGDQLLAVDGAELDREWDLGSGKVRGATIRHWEQTSDARVDQEMRGHLEAWDREPERNRLIATAIVLRLAVRSRRRPAFLPGNTLSVVHGPGSGWGRWRGRGSSLTSRPPACRRDRIRDRWEIGNLAR